MSALLSAITDKSTIHSVHCAIMRGGTSKAIVFAAADLPADPRSRDQLILAAFGSPDPRQIDGLGGAVADAKVQFAVPLSHVPGILAVLLPCETTLVRTLPPVGGSANAAEDRR